MKVSTFIVLASFVLAALVLPGTEAKIPASDAKTDRWGQDITGKVYTTALNQRAWHGSNLKLDESNLKSRPLWLATWSTNALGAAINACHARGVKRMKAVAFGDGQPAKSCTLYLHLFQIESPTKLVNLAPDAEANKRYLAEAAGLLDGLDKEDIEEEMTYLKSTMGNPSDWAKPYTNGMCKKKDGTPASNGWRSAWDQDEIMLCPPAQHLKMIKLIECNAFEVLKFQNGGKTPTAWKDAKVGSVSKYEHDKSGKHVSFDMQLNGVQTVLEMMENAGICKETFNYKLKNTKLQKKELLQ